MSMYFVASRLAFFTEPFGEDSVEVSDEEHNALMDDINQGEVLSADENGYPTTTPAPVVEMPLAELTQNRVDDLNADYEKGVWAVRGSYPSSEISTWDLQIEQAKSYNAWRQGGRVGDPPMTDFLTDLSNSRTRLGIEGGIDDLTDRILANNTLVIPAMAELTARRHAAEKALLTAQYMQDIEAVKAVEWDFSLTGPGS